MILSYVRKFHPVTGNVGEIKCEIFSMSIKDRRVSVETAQIFAESGFDLFLTGKNTPPAIGFTSDAESAESEKMPVIAIISSL
ncbi:MAG: hypothetical protein PHX30_03490 [Candidatus Pacebacteria bacterium]|nr:hypothetical protein [Candidatus Paceibacterota bacterium]